MKFRNSAVIATSVLCALAAAGCTTPSTQTSTLPPGTQRMSQDLIDYNTQSVDAAARVMQEEARQKEAARAAAQAEAARVKAAQDAQAAKARAAAQKAKSTRQAKLDAYQDKVRELELELKQLDVAERRAQVDGTVADSKARSELARERAQLELDRMRAEIENLKAADAK